MWVSVCVHLTMWGCFVYQINNPEMDGDITGSSGLWVVGVGRWERLYCYSPQNICVCTNQSVNANCYVRTQGQRNFTPRCNLKDLHK